MDCEIARDTRGYEASAGWGATATRGPAFQDREATQSLPDDGVIAGPIWLTILVDATASRPRSVPLAPGEAIVLGTAREGGADTVRVDDGAVSARHCRVRHTGAAIVVEDLGSRNGVRVSGARVAGATLELGGAFEIGRTVVRVDPATRSAARDRPLDGLIGGSPAMLRLASSVRKIAALKLPVLLRGESGTGKDLVARAVHDESPRKGQPFVALNAATISRELAESELFGHQRGAFTGAVRDRKGAFREASGGTLFLDEIASLSLEVQAKLLRVVEEGTVRPLGAEASVPVDVRLVVATCEPLERMVKERLFRADLYERIAVCVVQVPALRDRPDDIPALARHLLKTSELGARELSPGALGVLRAQTWTGNVRELRNVTVQAALRAGGRVQAEHVIEAIAERSPAKRRLEPDDAAKIFVEAGKNQSAAARRAGVPRSTMRDLLRAAGVMRES
ncbi:MAG: sigma 54-interacting transcriptional regulator [Byssovorax sp.]